MSATITTTLTITAFSGIPTVRPGDDLAGLMLSGAETSGVRIMDGDIIVLAQKIVSKAEGRTVRLDSVVPTSRAMELADVCKKDPRIVELILGETREILRCRPGVIVVEDRRGFVMANAGIDASNVEASGDGETVLLLPADPDASAEKIRQELHARTGRALAVVINDSFGRAWRLGTVGTALGVSGMPALLDLRGRTDRNGRQMISSELGVADEVAAAASLAMGQGNEGRPIVHVRGFPYEAAAGTGRDLLRPRDMDLFR